MKNYIVVLLFVLLMAAFPILASAADPGHGAASISAGTFEAGNFTFPNWLSILGTLNATTMNPNINLTVDSGTLFVDAGNNKVGIGTTTPKNTLDVVGDINATSTVYSNNAAVLTAETVPQFIKRRSSGSNAKQRGDDLKTRIALAAVGIDKMQVPLLAKDFHKISGDHTFSGATKAYSEYLVLSGCEVSIEE